MEGDQPSYQLTHRWAWQHDASGPAALLIDACAELRCQPNFTALVALHRLSDERVARLLAIA